MSGVHGSSGGGGGGGGDSGGVAVPTPTLALEALSIPANGFPNVVSPYSTTLDASADAAGVKPLVGAATDALVDYCYTNGLVIKKGGANAAGVVNIPTTLFPGALSRSLFTFLYELQLPVNEMVHNVALDTAFLLKHLESTTKTDEYTKRLVDIMVACLAEGMVQTAQLGIHRCDYMMHYLAATDTIRPLQVEINTISSAFAPIGAGIIGMHSYLASTQALGDDATLAQSIPPSAGLSTITAAMVTAVKVYAAKLKRDDGASSVPTLRILFVVEEGEKNSIDQRMLEYSIASTSGIRCMRLSLGEIARRGSLTADDRRLLLIDGVHEIALVYFRAGYAPRHYIGEAEWDAKLRLERSMAIKCPSIQYYLAGTKKIQQVLTEPGMLEQFIDEAGRPGLLDALRYTFANIYSLDESDTTYPAGVAALKAQVIANAADYVMKPSREGGGNLLTGDEMVAALRTWDAAKLQAYIIMDRIAPKPVPNYIVRNEAAVRVPQTVTEYGVFGVMLGDGRDAVFNVQAGYIARTKDANVEDGGVSAGVANMDSVVMV